MIVILLTLVSQTSSLREEALLSASSIGLRPTFYSDKNYTALSESEMADDPSIDPRQKLVMTTFILTLIFAIGAPKNFQVVRCLLCNRNKLYNKSRHHLLLLNLAIADSIVLFLMIPSEIGWRMTSEWKAGNIGCKLFQFVRVFGLYASSMVLICISIDRYYAVVQPFRYGSMSSRISKLLKISWLFSFLISTPQLYIFRLQTPPRDPAFYQCASFDSWPHKWNEKWYTYFHLMFLYLVPLIAIVGCYTGICIKSFSRAVKMDSRATVSQQNANIPENDDEAGNAVYEDLSPEQAVSSASIKKVCISVDQGSKVDVIEMENISNTTGVASVAGTAVAVVPRPSLRSEKQCEVRRSILKQTFVIVLAFLICWTPYVTSAFLYQVNPISFKGVNLQLQDLFHLFAVSNSAVNPFIYGKFVRSDQRSG